MAHQLTGRRAYVTTEINHLGCVTIDDETWSARTHGDRIIPAGQREAEILQAEGFSTALERIFNVASTVDARTMSLQYFDTVKSLGSSPSTKFIFPMEFTSMLAPFLGMGQPGEPDRNEQKRSKTTP